MGHRMSGEAPWRLGACDLERHNTVPASRKRLYGNPTTVLFGRQAPDHLEHDSRSPSPIGREAIRGERRVHRWLVFFLSWRRSDSIRRNTCSSTFLLLATRPR